MTTMSIGGNGGIQITGRASTPEKQARMDEHVHKVKDAIDKALRASGIVPHWSQNAHLNGTRYPDGWRLSPNLQDHELGKAKAIVVQLCELSGIPKREET